MIVKVSKGEGDWLLINDVRSIDYSSVARTATSGEELQQQLDEAKDQQLVNGCEVKNVLIDIDWDNPPERIQPKRPYQFNIMIIYHCDKSITLVFYDHPVYLCDDAGNTVEKVTVR